MELRVCSACQKVCPGETACPHCGGVLSLASPEFFLGKSFGKYRLESVLGVGGMGVVYLAWQSTLSRKVALKLILPEADETELRQRFLREARLLAGIHHPNIVEIYDFDVNEWDVPFYVMEYLEGRTLRELLRERGRLAPWELVPILRDVGAGLTSAHHAGVVHRDLKPENIFLARYDGGQVAKILDFGIARTLGAPETEAGLTRTGMIVGTLNYLAPEQLLGQEITPATDQFALALVVVELLTGKSVRSGKTLSRIIAEEIVRPLEIPELAREYPGLGRVIARATDPDPHRRFPDVESFVEAVATGLGSSALADETVPTVELGRRTGDPVAAGEVAGGESGSARSRRFRRLLLGSAVATAVLAGGLALWHTRGGEGSRSMGSLVLEREVKVPVDAGRILAADPELLVLGGMDGVILQGTGGDRPPARLPMDPDQVLGPAPDGRLLIRKGDRLFIRDPAGREVPPWADGVPPGEDVVISPDGASLVSSSGETVSVLRLEFPHFRPAFRVHLGFKPEMVKAGKRLLAVAGGGNVEAWSLASGRKVLEVAFPETRVTAMAVDDLADRVAVAGWFDTVAVFHVDDGSVERIPRRQGATGEVSLAFVDQARGPALAVAEAGGLSLWLPSRQLLGRWDREGAKIVDLLKSAGRLFALDVSSHSVLIFSLGGISSRLVVPYAHDSAWASVADPPRKRVLIGNENGVLYAVSTEDGRVERRVVHTQGITSLVTDGRRLASASDDRTIAVWRLPDLAVEWRSRAHGFLVNQIVLLPGKGVLWSASSDGLVKRWSWPDLKELATLDTSDLVGRRVSLHAIWVSRDERRMLLGTWDHLALFLERGGKGTWSARKLHFTPHAGYGIADLGALQALVLLGVDEPSGMAVYDLRRGSFLPIRSGDGSFLCHVTLDGGKRLLAFGNNEILDFHFRRDEEGVLRYTLAVVRHRNLGFASTATLLPGGRVAVANSTGTLHILDVGDIRGVPLCDVPVEVQGPTAAARVPAA